jgi:hypothetical protein
MAKCFGVIAKLVVTGFFAGRCPVTAPRLDFGRRLLFGEGGRPQKTMVCPTGRYSATAKNAGTDAGVAG